MKLFYSSQQTSEKRSNIKFHENPSSGSRDVPRQQAGGQTDRQTDITKLIVVFRNFPDAPKKRGQASTPSSALKVVIPASTQPKTTPLTLSEQNIFNINTLCGKLCRSHRHLSQDFPTVIYTYSCIEN